MDRKFIFVLAGVALLVLLAVGTGVGIIVYHGIQFDRQSREYVKEAVVAIAQDWDKEELVGRGSREFLAVSDEDIEKVMVKFRELGALQSYQGASGQANMNYTTDAGKRVTARYVANLEFETGPATAVVDLIREDGQWKIYHFTINSKVFLE